ncbi:monocarboxylate transporter 10 [Lingula anatina]|uniref:Monocarboxylate transporter 10 n=1 Tax=Lingula anatina TaxID=7574 RepID=A0A1S3HZ18_LINAN|nr:monocarboxylate transporter 10 [Lingula anatina]|eukprot:XP_013390816.1 monocarboxylate transporter 10 [Lingula anatina]
MVTKGKGDAPKIVEPEQEPLKSEDKEQPAKGSCHLEFIPPDGGWGWVVCLASCWTNGTIFGILNNFGILFPKMLEAYAKDDPHATFRTSWIGSLCVGMTFFMSMIASILTDRLGIRVTACAGALIATAGILASSFIEQLELMYLTYGILLGTGCSLVYTPSLVILGHYFKKRLGLVNGIVTLGSAIFTIVLPYVLKHALHTIGFKHTVHILVALVALLFLCAISWKPLIVHPSKSQHSGVEQFLSTATITENMSDCMRWTRRFLNVKIWRQKGYVIWVIAVPVCLFGYFIPFAYLVKHVKDVLGESANSEILIMCLGGTSGVSRLVSGKLADVKWVNRIRLQQAAFVVLGICTLCIPFATHFAVFVVIVLIMGLCDGCFVCLLGPIAFDLVGSKGASQAVGFLLGLMSVPMMIGPPIGGMLKDHFGSYNSSFWYAGIPPIIGAAIMFLIPKHKQQFPAVFELEEFAAMATESYDDEEEWAANEDYLKYYIHSDGIWQMHHGKPWKGSPQEEDLEKAKKQFTTKNGFLAVPSVIPGLPQNKESLTHEEDNINKPGGQGPQLTISKVETDGTSTATVPKTSGESDAQRKRHHSDGAQHNKKPNGSIKRWSLQQPDNIQEDTIGTGEVVIAKESVL